MAANITRTYPHPSISTASPLLHSFEATATPDFHFCRPSEHATPIYVLDTPNPLAFCVHTKDWLLAQFKQPKLSAHEILRMDTQDLHLLDPTQPGRVIILTDAVALDGNPGLPVSILALEVPHDDRIRWFYTLIPLRPLLTLLDSHDLLNPNPHLHHPTTPSHARLYTYLHTAFTTALTPPHAADYTTAITTTDYTPLHLPPTASHPLLHRIIDALPPSSANARLITSVLHPSLDPDDDRYAPCLHPVERDLATLAGLQCAEYLMAKRSFFKAFWEAVARSDKRGIERVDDVLESDGKVGVAAGASADVVSRSATPALASAGSAATPATPRGRRKPRVRTEKAHQAWLEGELQLRGSKAKVLVVGWREMGFLVEGRFLGWTDAGGMREMGESLEGG